MTWVRLKFRTKRPTLTLFLRYSLQLLMWSIGYGASTSARARVDAATRESALAASDHAAHLDLARPHLIVSP